MQLRSDIHRHDRSRSGRQYPRLNLGDGGLDHLSERCGVETPEQHAANQRPGNDSEPEGSDQDPKPTSKGGQWIAGEGGAKDDPSESSRLAGGQEQGEWAGEGLAENEELTAVGDRCLDEGQEFRVAAQPVGGIGNDGCLQSWREDPEEWSK
jgi:hypothetical protein